MSYTPNKYGESFINRDYHSLDDRPVGTKVTIKTTKGNLREYEKYRDGDYYPNPHIDIVFDEVKGLEGIKKTLKKLTLKLA